MRRGRPGLVVLVVLPLTSLLGGCTAGLIAAQAMPAAMGSVAMAASDDRSPFRSHDPYLLAPGEDDIATVTARIRLAECGDARSQYWLASRLGNDFNKAPDRVQIYKWFLLSEMGEYAPAGARRAALEVSMSEDDVEQARVLAAAWQPATENCQVGG